MTTDDDEVVAGLAPPPKRRKVGRGVLHLGPDEIEWVNKKWRTIRRASTLADAQNAEWQKLSDEVESYLDRSGVGDVLQRARIKEQNLGLRDAVEAGEWLGRSAQRHIDDLNLFLRLKELGLL